MQIVDVPGVGEVEFPDEMGDAEILAAAQKLSAPKLMASHAPGAEVPGAIPPPPAPAESGARGGLQGLSFGWGDEASGAIAAALPFTDPEAAKGETFGERYANARDFYRGKNAAAEQANPGTYLAGQVVGAAVPALVAPAGNALRVAAGQGLAQGAGYSEREDLGLASDTALGGALGLAGYGAGALVGKGLAAAKRAGGNLVRTGTARAAQQGAEEATAPVRSLEAAARERAANAYRQMERINLALADDALPAGERAALEAFKASPEYAALVAANAKGVLGVAPEAVAELEAARAVASQARADLPQAIQARTGELLTPQPKADAKSFTKGWLEPLAWMYGGKKVGDALGLDTENKVILTGAAGLVGGRTRAGKALWTRLNRPAHQAAIGGWLESRAAAASGPAPSAVGRAATVGVPAAVADWVSGKESDTGPQDRFRRSYGDAITPGMRDFISSHGSKP